MQQAAIHAMSLTPPGRTPWIAVRPLAPPAWAATERTAAVNGCLTVAPTTWQRPCNRMHIFSGTATSRRGRRPASEDKREKRDNRDDPTKQSLATRAPRRHEPGGLGVRQRG